MTGVNHSCLNDIEGLRPVGAFVIWVVSSIADYAYCVWNIFVVVSFLMKRLFLFVLVLSMGCTHYFVRDSSQYNLTKEELDFLKSKKIGLIGFYPFDYRVESVSGMVELNIQEYKIDNQQHLKMIRFVNDNAEKKEILTEYKDSFVWFARSQQNSTRKISAFFNPDSRTISLMEFGIDSSQLKSSNKFKTIQESKLKLFLSEYLSKTKHLGLEVIEPLVDSSKKNLSKKENLQLKDFDVDYWIITFHAPNSGRLDGLFVLTAMPFLLTLGFFPTISSAETESTFWIFDKELNLLKNAQYQDRFYSITSWLAFGGTVEGLGTNGGTRTANIYEPDIKQFSKELLQVLKK